MGRELHRAVWGRVGAAVIPLVVGRLFDHWLQTRTSAEPEKHQIRCLSIILDTNIQTTSYSIFKFLYKERRKTL